MSETKSADQLAQEVKAAFDTRHDQVKAIAEEALGKAAKGEELSAATKQLGADGLVQITLSAGFDENDADLAIARAAILVKTASLFENREGAACLAFDTLVGQLKCRWI